MILDEADLGRPRSRRRRNDSEVNWDKEMTLVSYKHNFVYLKTRKTAGTSTEMFLQAYCVPPGKKVTEYQPHPIVSEYGIAGRRRVSETLKWYQKPRHLWQVRNGTHNWYPHMAASKVKAGLDPEFWEQALKISSVRNPFKRMISAYYWSLKQRNGAQTNRDDVIDGFRRKILSRKIQNDHAIVFLDGEFVPDVLIRQEHLADDLNALVDRLGLDPSLAHLPVTKKTNSSSADQRPSTAEFYDEETADIVRDRFSWVFEHANYSLEVPH